MILKKTEIGSYRDLELKAIKNTCPVLKVKMKRSGAIRPVLDHCHSLPSFSDDPSQCGRIRGVISQAANTFLGYVEKYYRKYCEKHTDESLPDILRNLADFLDRDFSENPVHHIEIDKHRKRLSRISTAGLRVMLEKEGVNAGRLDKDALILLYISEVILPSYQMEDI